jgi:hypothetical protein
MPKTRRQPSYPVEVEHRPDRESELRALMLCLGMTQEEIGEVLSLRRERTQEVASEGAA